MPSSLRCRWSSCPRPAAPSCIHGVGTTAPSRGDGVLELVQLRVSLSQTPLPEGGIGVLDPSIELPSVAPTLLGENNRASRAHGTEPGAPPAPSCPFDSADILLLPILALTLLLLPGRLLPPSSRRPPGSLSGPPGHRQLGSPAPADFLQGTFPWPELGSAARLSPASRCTSWAGPGSQALAGPRQNEVRALI